MVLDTELEHFDQADYYRPFLCKQDIRTVTGVDIFIVGTNPATPIRPSDMNALRKDFVEINDEWRLNAYIGLLLNHEKFACIYKSLRGTQERTRMKVSLNG